MKGAAPPQAVRPSGRKEPRRQVGYWSSCCSRSRFLRRRRDCQRAGVGRRRRRGLRRGSRRGCPPGRIPRRPPGSSPAGPPLPRDWSPPAAWPGTAGPPARCARTAPARRAEAAKSASQARSQSRRVMTRRRKAMSSGSSTPPPAAARARSDGARRRWAACGRRQPAVFADVLAARLRPPGAPASPRSAVKVAVLGRVAQHPAARLADRRPPPRRRAGNANEIGAGRFRGKFGLVTTRRDLLQGQIPAAAPSGATTLASVSRLLRKSPLVSRASTVNRACSSAEGQRPFPHCCPAPAEIVQLTVCAQKAGNPPSAPSQFAQRPVASDVQATERPSPYCQATSSGSS